MSIYVPRLEEIDLSARTFWEQDALAREASFAVLRREQSVSWQRPSETGMLPPEEATEGYWAVVGYDDVRRISRDPATFCSGQGVILDDLPQEILDATQSFLATDAPRHTKLRGLVNAAFTPRQIRRLEDQIRAGARQIVQDVAALGECDFVEHIAKRLPLMMFIAMLGVWEEGGAEAVEAADRIVGWNDPEVLDGEEPLEVIFSSMLTLTGLALEMAEKRAAEPTGDLMSALVHAEVDGERLLEEEIGAFFVLLSVAANDTTRHTTSHAMRALTEFPDQRALLLEDLPGRIDTAVEEMVRWASAVMTFRRTALRDVEVGGQLIREGQNVVMFYSSANRDETAFDHPERFDVLRDPNHHAGFGGGGPHYCLGASLARLQLRSIFTELLTTLPDIEVGEPELLVGNFIHGIKRMPCRFTAR
jgi:cytochrome P450